MKLPFPSLHAWLLGIENRENPVEVMRVQVLLSIAALTGTFMWSYAILGIFVINHPSIFWGFVYALTHLCSLLVFKKTRSYHWATACMVLPGGLFQLHFSLLSGGLHAATVVWVAILPLIAGVLAGPKSARYWAVYSVFLVTCVPIAESLGLSANLISPAGETIARYMVMYGMIAMCAGFTIYLIGINQESEAKLRAKSVEKQTLLRILIHDIANPLMVLKMRLESLKEDFELGNKLDAEKGFLAMALSLDKIEKNIRLVRELEAAESGKAKLAKEVIELSKLFLQLKESFDAQVQRKQIKFQTHSEPDHQLSTSAIIFECQILNNLITNAIKFTRPGGTITLGSHPQPQNERIEIRVTDDGVGIPPGLQANLFDPSVPTTRTGTDGEQGTGFGLPIVKSTVETLGGRISVTSEPNKGTTFTLSFPLKT